MKSAITLYLTIGTAISLVTLYFMLLKPDNTEPSRELADHIKSADGFWEISYIVFVVLENTLKLVATWPYQLTKSIIYAIKVVNRKKES